MRRPVPPVPKSWAGARRWSAASRGAIRWGRRHGQPRRAVEHRSPADRRRSGGFPPAPCHTIGEKRSGTGTHRNYSEVSLLRAAILMEVTKLGIPVGHLTNLMLSLDYWLGDKKSWAKRHQLSTERSVKDGLQRAARGEEIIFLFGYNWDERPMEKGGGLLTEKNAWANLFVDSNPNVTSVIKIFLNRLFAGL